MPKFPSSHQREWDGSRLSSEVREGFRRLPELVRGTTKGQLAYWDGGKWASIDPGESGQVLQSAGEDEPTWVTLSSGGVTVLERESSTNTIVNTAARTSLYSYTIPASTLLTDQVVRVTVYALYKNNTGLNKTFRVYWKLGATELYEDGTGSFGDNSAKAPCRFTFCVAAKGSSSAQTGWGRVEASSAGSAGNPTTGIGDMGTGGGSAEIDGLIGMAEGVAEDGTSALTLELSIKHSSADANQEIVRTFAMVEQL